MLAKRLAIGLSMVALLLAVMAVDDRLAPYYPLWLVAALVVMGAASLELVDLLGRAGAKASGNTVFGGVMAIALANWAPHVLSTAPAIGPPPAYDPLAPVHALAWPLLAFAATLMGAFVARALQYDRPGDASTAIAGSMLAVAYVGILGSFVLQLRWLGAVPLACMVAAAKGSDTGAYTFGRLFGRHKLWPRLSPNKTVEGALGGLAGGVAFTLLVTALARFGFGLPVLPWGQAVGFGVVVGASAQLGDLMESMLKRDGDRKDASAAVPGFGGVLDVVDSLLFAAPVAFVYWLAVGG